MIEEIIQSDLFNYKQNKSKRYQKQQRLGGKVLYKKDFSNQELILIQSGKMNESTRMPLKDVIHECEERWFEEYQEEFENGTSSDSQIIYAQLLLQGSSKRPPDVKQTISIYKKLSRYSAEAAYRLGQIYLKGKYAPVDLENAYFYIKIATYFRCKCGLSAELIHSGKVSHVHVCYQNEAKKKYATFVIDEEMKNKLNNRIYSWKNNNYI